MANVSIGLALNVIVDSLIWNIRVSVDAAVTNARQHLVTLELLVRKW